MYVFVYLGRVNNMCIIILCVGNCVYFKYFKCFTRTCISADLAKLASLAELYFCFMFCCVLLYVRLVVFVYNFCLVICNLCNYFSSLNFIFIVVYFIFHVLKLYIAIFTLYRYIIFVTNKITF